MATDHRQRTEDRDVRQSVALVGHVELDRGHAALEHGGQLREPDRIRVAEIDVQAVVDNSLACRIREALLEPVDERLSDGRLGEVDDGRDAAERGCTRARRKGVRRQGRVRGERGIGEMDVTVDCALDHVEPARVELDGAGEIAADRGDPLAGDGDVRDDRLLRRHDKAARDHEVVAQGSVR